MAARPRKDYSFHVKRRGPSWVGFWRTYDGDKLVPHQKVIGNRKEITKTEAVARHAAWVREHVPAYGATPEKPTLQQLWERRIAEERRRAERGKLSIATVGQHVSYWAHLKPMADVDAKKITGEQIEDLFDGMQLASKSKKHVRQLLRSILRPVGVQAVDDAAMRFEMAPKGPTFEADAIFGILRNLPTDHDRLIFQLCLVTGLRASELARLSGEHLREPGFMHVPGKKTALSKSRIPLIPEIGLPLAKLVAERGTAARLLFSQKTHRQWLEKVYQPTAERVFKASALANRPDDPAVSDEEYWAKVKDGYSVDMLMLRRTAGTKGAKVDEGATAKLMRHTTTRMIREVYDSAADDAVLDVQRAVWAGITKREKVS